MSENRDLHNSSPSPDKKLSQGEGSLKPAPNNLCPLCGKHHREGLCEKAAILVVNPVSPAVLS